MFLGLLGLLSPASFAFAPSQDVWIGIEPARTFHRHEYRQRQLRAQAGWAAFVDGEGYGWQARFDERTGTPRRAWGPGIDLGTLASGKDADGALRRLFARNPDLLAVPLDELRLKSANYVARTDTWYVDYTRVVAGAPIWRGGVTARIKDGELLLLGIDTHPALHGIEPAEIDADEAIAAAELSGPAAMAAHKDESATLVILPMEVAGALRYRLTWEVRSRTATPVGKWVSHVDARTGELLNVYNEVRFLDGTLLAMHDTRTVDGSFSTSGVPLATLTGAISGAIVATGEDGTFSVDGAEGWSTRLRGSYVTVNNEGGAEGSLAFTGDSAPTWTTASADLAEIDSYVFLHDVRTWGLQFGPDVGIVTDPLRSNVNLASTCNAYYDGNVNFYEAGDGCNNTGRIADVNYHEWGHGFHYYSLRSGSFDGSISEGIGDIVAALQTHDTTIAPYFGTNGAGIREIATDYVYPDDVTGEVHQDGLIFAGAMWDLYVALSATYGESTDTKGTAWAITSQLLADTLKGGPTIEESYDELVLADDDNGDLSDGTPHFCEIIDAFGRHGLGPNGGGSSLLTLDHSPLGNQAAGAGIALEGDVSNLSPACVTFTVETVDAVYSTDGGTSWNEAPLGLAGEHFDGDLPGLPAGTVVEYYLRASADDGTEVTLPAGGEIAPYTFYVGALEEIYCEPFEDDGGYTHALLDGTDQRGADDWDFGSPDGYSDDPTDAFTGSAVWGNDLGGGQYNGAYQSSIVNRLSSPAIDVTGEAQVVVQYRRWLNVEDGVYDQAHVYAGDELVWSNYKTGERDGGAHTEDREWMLHTLLVDTDSTSLTLGWEIASDGGLEFGGWNVDDVCVYRIAEDASLDFAIDDFVASDDLDERVALAWTQPDDARAAQAVVVRRADRFPANRDDGEQVWSGAAPPGSAMTATDASAGGYYAVFAGGADGWITGAVEGDNADIGAAIDANGDGLYDGTETDGVTLTGDCGCASGSDAGTGGALLAVGAGLLALARRRRSE
ncbi:MAG: M36 family metallopeptidase [Pseudomonadota bacterium]|nr:M36 family metallopeptidase [Pseudomonadota bacterium]